MSINFIVADALIKSKGRGAFGSVVKARNKIDNRIYAGSKSRLSHMQHELTLLRSKENPPQGQSERPEDLPRSDCVSAFIPSQYRAVLYDMG